MSNYIEEYLVLGRRYGIEDFKSPGGHFFNGKDPATGKPEPRFMLWAGGCGIGLGTKTLKEAREYLHAYITTTITHELNIARRQVKECQKELNRLGATPPGLQNVLTRKKKK